MNKKNLLVVSLFFVLFLILSFNLNQKKNTNSNNLNNKYEEYVVDSGDMIKEKDLSVSILDLNITAEEKAGLILMREEEKLARDVYRHLGEKWGMNIFFNIADSEQTHTNAIKVLLERYGVEDPVKDDISGKFTSLEMSKLYEELIQKGEKSIVDAIMVGAIIEDLDIKDLEVLLGQTTKEDIVLTYKNLQKGSRNHLRAYSKNLDRQGITYAPQYISEEIYKQIISSEQERGTVK
ncbi:MAG: hypothetical protein UT05_C0002G0032 [Parcubacteria group bacterium GW2011_GWF2_38_76]|nr:MAG: hypothetical protein UT05_C0002G0032 [Parcubacteria group bacterium GW2011_GWF2_38_76]HBM45810.1 hypothetical protein [Patescibacteria group bacterium]